MSISNAHYAIFNNYNLQSTIPSLTILSIDAYKVPKRKLSIDNIARTNKNKVSSAFFVEKNISITVSISNSTRQATESVLDSLFQLLQGLEKDLIIPQSGAQRKYTATLTDVVEKKAGTAYWEGDLVFACSEVFGYDTAPTLIASATGTSSQPRTDQYTFTGSADRQLPIITITYTAVTGGTGASVIVGNGTTGQQITVNRDWVAGDILVINCQEQSVKVNGTDVDFTGAFPGFEPGVGYLTYSDNFTTRTFNLLANYYKRWV